MELSLWQDRQVASCANRYGRAIDMRSGIGDAMCDVQCVLRWTSFGRGVIRELVVLRIPLKSAGLGVRCPAMLSSRAGNVVGKDGGAAGNLEVSWK